MSELGELRASLARAQRELEAAHDRLESIEARDKDGSATVLTPRGFDRQRRKLVTVGVLSSAGTALLLGLLLLSAGSKPAPQASAPPTPMTPTTPVRQTPPPTVAIPDPPAIVTIAPVPVVTPPDPPQAPLRVARANSDPPARTRAADEDDKGTLTIICMPKCDAITDNGVAIGPGHVFNRPVSPGPHHLVLHAPNGQTKAINVTVQPDRPKEVRVTMVDASGIF